MTMHNPPHPGEFITEVYLEPNNLSGRELAAKLGVAASTLNRILTGASGISPEMALRLSNATYRVRLNRNFRCFHAIRHAPFVFSFRLPIRNRNCCIQTHRKDYGA